jgi:periplasmic protein TonB
MFSTLESNWDQSARKGRATFASFTIQVFSLGLLIAISMLWIERPPRVRWVQLSVPTAFTPGGTHPASGRHTASRGRSDQIIAPRLVAPETPRTNEAGSGPTAAEAPSIDVGGGDGANLGIRQGLGDSLPPVIPQRPAAVRPFLVSHWAEGNLLHRVQPIYPPLARQARVQGTVELRAIISKTGTIENLVVVSGHQMLSTAAIEAVKQWRYRPYLLNNEPVEVETEITVNFVLSGG